jgi:hypothetical protein
MGKFLTVVEKDNNALGETVSVKEDRKGLGKHTLRVKLVQ